jgi:hypothetical protein
MANPYTVQPLGGFNVGQALGQLGQQFGQMRREDEAMQQQQQMQELMAQAAAGDTNAINQLMAINPQAAQAFEQRLQGQQGAEQAVMKQRTTDALERLYFAPEEQRLDMFQQMVADPSLDIDEEDVNVLGNQQAFQAALGELKGKDWAATAFGGQEQREVAPQMLGKYTPESIQAFQKSGDYAQLKEVGEKAPTAQQAEMNKLKKQEQQLKIEKAEQEKAKRIFDLAQKKKDVAKAREIEVQEATTAIGHIDDLLKGDLDVIYGSQESL